MKYSFFQAIGIAALLLVTISCSQKTTTPSNNQNVRQERPQGNRSPKGGAPQFSDLLARMDANKDGQLSKAEAKGPLQNDFATIDKNNDGFISEAEFKQAPPPQRQRRTRGN